MEKKEIVKQMIDLHKASFENYFSIMVMLQDQTENLLKPFVDNVPGINDECKKVMDNWVSEYKKNRDEFKKVIDSGYAKVEAFFDYNAILAFQEQNEKIFNAFLDQGKLMPQDFKKAMDKLAATYKNSRDEFKKYVEENINRVGDFSSPANKPRQKVKQQK
jgi:polyhydroxyalkanoate synthesis regulator phasin